MRKSANASRTFPEQFQYSFLLQDGEGRAITKKLSHDSQFQAESLPAGRYRLFCAIEGHEAMTGTITASW